MVASKVMIGALLGVGVAAPGVPVPFAPVVFPKSYRGAPFQDARHPGGAQAIPGRVQCAFFDVGGEGVAYHDSDAVNHGSGMLNPANGSYLNEFRMREGVDISYTKFGKDPQVDDSPYDLVRPPEDQLYVGWTEPGEWFNLTVQAAKAGVYEADLLYTSNRGGSIALDVNGKAEGGAVKIASTFDKADPVAWRQWHHWNVKEDAVKVRLPAGKSVLTVHVVEGGQMNLASLDFHEAR